MKKLLSRRWWLLPLVPLYQVAVSARELGLRWGVERVRKLRRPVISVGSVSAGGAGKTPLTIELARALVERGAHVDVLSRGYGRRGKSAARVDVDGTADDFGDEPLLIAREASVPVYVAAQRYEAGRLAEANISAVSRFGVHLLDDGFQHRQLFRDLDIVLLDGRDWRDGLLPAGNLREPMKALRRAGAIAIPADDAQLEGQLQAWGWQGPVWRLRRRMEVPKVAGAVVAFCGIARPEQFFDGLEGAGCAVAGRVAFQDHHGYTGGDVERLIGMARETGTATLMTTEKDRVRLGDLPGTLPDGLGLRTALLRIEIEDREGAVDWVMGRIGASFPRA